MRVLVVDDDAIFREELAELLADEGHTVHAAPNVAKAIESLEQDEVDVVLTDLKMPRQSGMQLLREVRTRWPRTLVVMITGFATVETALESMKLGAFDYVRKPFRIEELRATLTLVAQEREFRSAPPAARDAGREARSLAASGEHPVLYFGPHAPRAASHVEFVPLDPAAPAELLDLTRTFLDAHPTGGVVIDGLDRMLARHRLEDVVATLDQLRSLLEGHGPLRVAFDPTQVTTAAAAAVAGTVAADETQGTLEAMANPIRRRVLQRLATGPAPFGEVMAAAGLDDSPKMSFHLRKLLDADLATHEEDTYRLSSRGRAVVRLLIDATFLPLSSDAGNQAFAAATSGAATPPRRPDA
jgi:CheY-like chemotaxis protein